jgi:hypothetical protein
MVMGHSSTAVAVKVYSTSSGREQAEEAFPTRRGPRLD